MTDQPADKTPFVIPEITKKDALLISAIARKAVINGLIRDRLTLEMDITTVHAKNPLRLSELLAANDYEFVHDVCGISHHINRQTGKLEDYFEPRFTA